MSAVGLPMGDQEEGSTGSGLGNSAEEVASLLKEHAVVLGRVAMALLGDAPRVEQVLEEVARNAGSKKLPADMKPLTWLLGFVRSASATQLSKLPLRGQTKAGAAFEPPPPTTERIGAGVALPARASLASLKPTEREAVVLALVGGLDASEVAIACNVDLGTAKTRLARGLEQLMTAK